jgi:hypothetical protein
MHSEGRIRARGEVEVVMSLRQGFSNFFVPQPFLSICKISATLKCHKVQQIKGNWSILVDFGDP